MPVDFGSRRPAPGYSQVTIGGAVTAAGIEALIPAAGAGVDASVYATDDGSRWAVASLAGVLTWVHVGGQASVLAKQLVSLCGGRATIALAALPLYATFHVFVPSDYTVAPTSVKLRLLLSVGATATATVKLYNVTDGVYVVLGAAAATTITETAQTPTVKTSTELVGAVGFSIAAQKVYRLELYTSDATLPAALGSAELVVS